MTTGVAHYLLGWDLPYPIVVLLTRIYECKLI